MRVVYQDSIDYPDQPAEVAELAGFVYIKDYGPHAVVILEGTNSFITVPLHAVTVIDPYGTISLTSVPEVL